MKYFYGNTIARPLGHRLTIVSYFSYMKKVININLIIDTLPSRIVHQTCRSHHSQVKGLISTSNLTECITPFQHSLCIFCRN